MGLFVKMLMSGVLLSIVAIAISATNASQETCHHPVVATKAINGPCIAPYRWENAFEDSKHWFASVANQPSQPIWELWKPIKQKMIHVVELVSESNWVAKMLSPNQTLSSTASRHNNTHNSTNRKPTNPAHKLSHAAPQNLTTGYDYWDWMAGWYKAYPAISPSLKQAALVKQPITNRRHQPQKISRLEVRSPPKTSTKQNKKHASKNHQLHGSQLWCSPHAARVLLTFKGTTKLPWRLLHSSSKHQRTQYTDRYVKKMGGSLQLYFPSVLGAQINALTQPSKPCVLQQIAIVPSQLNGKGKPLQSGLRMVMLPATVRAALQSRTVGKNSQSKSMFSANIKLHRSPEKTVVEIVVTPNQRLLMPTAAAATASSRLLAARKPHHGLSAYIPQTIMIDAGHGGKDPGAMAYGLQEKDITLKVAKRLQALFQEHSPHIKMRMTRTTDQTVSLSQRAQLTNQLNADLLISIHFNAVSDKKMRGLQTFFLNNTSDSQALAIAKRENMGYVSNSMLQGIFADLKKDINLLQSGSMARRMHHSILKTLRSHRYTVPDMGVKQAPFMVLLGVKMPAVLVEGGFLTNKQDNRRLRQSQYLNQLAIGIYNGVIIHIQKNVFRATHQIERIQYPHGLPSAKLQNSRKIKPSKG